MVQLKLNFYTAIEIVIIELIINKHLVKVLKNVLNRVNIMV